jgi:hypothetical protein
MTITKEYYEQFKKCLKQRRRLDLVPNSGMLITFKELVEMHSVISKKLFEQFETETELQEKTDSIVDGTVSDTLRVCEQVFNQTIYDYVVNQRDFKTKIKTNQKYHSAIPLEYMSDLES